MAVFSGLSSYLKKSKKRAVIVLDEFQQIIRVNSKLEAEFRTIIQQQDRIAFAFLGSRTQLLKDMFSNEKRPFYHAAKIMELGPIETEDMGAPSLHKALSNLIKKDLIRKGKGREYYVADNFLHEWIRMVSK
ncbi:MAG: hypothetical protein JRJ65_12680 [Deltaproteobacteria bacterium]|nr:hypothetical protein [Deltaproteobacteria bacterium]